MVFGDLVQEAIVKWRPLFDISTRKTWCKFASHRH